MTPFRTRFSLKPASMDPSRALPRQVLEELLQDAVWAPTHGMTQPWRFMVFHTEHARRHLGKTLASLYDSLTPASEAKADKRSKLQAAPSQAAVAITFACHCPAAGKIPVWEEMAAVACAAQNLQLSAHLQGLGSYWSSPPITTSSQFLTWLGLDPAQHRGMGLLYLGWPVEGFTPPPRTRSPLSDSVRWSGE
jgi:nitroreductase